MKSRLRDRKEINVTLIEEKFHSSLDDFPLQVFEVIPAAGKSSRSERFFSSISVTFISLRSLILCLFLGFQSLIGSQAFEVVVLGAYGGPKESNLSGYLLAPKGADGFIALDAGSLLHGIDLAAKKIVLITSRSTRKVYGISRQKF